MKVPLQRLMHARVRDPEGRVVGRIYATKAEIRGADCVILEWHLGPAALLSRLGISAARLVGVFQRAPLRVPWDAMDLSNPEEPRLLRSVDDLRRGT